MATWKEWLRNNLLLLLTIASVVVGVIIGSVGRKAEPSRSTIELIAFPGELFMRMLQMAVLPLVTSSIMTGLATLDPKTSRRVFILSFSYYIFTTLVAIALGIVLVVLIAPGYRTKLEDSGDGAYVGVPQAAKVTSRDALFDLLRNMIPDNIAEACLKQYRTVYIKQKYINERNETVETYKKSVIYDSQMNILGIITVSVIAGIILGKMKERGKTLIECLSVVDNITMKLIMLVMWYSPVGIASLIAGKMLEMVDIWKTLSALAFYMITVITGFLIQMFIIQPLLYFLFTRNNPITFMRGLIQVWLTAFVTASSAATLPVTIRCCERNLEIDRRITRFVLPVGATVNMNGEALYEAVTAIFVAQLTGWELSALRLIIISLIATLCSIGAAAVPSSGVVTVVIVLNALGLGTQHVAMIFAIDWFIDRVRTSVNVIGDAFAAGVVYHYCRKVLQNLGTVQGSTEAIPERTDAIREETAIASVSSEEQTAMNVEEPAADKTVSGSVDEHSYRPEGNDILTPSSESRQNLKP